MRHSRLLYLSLALALVVGLALGNTAPARSATAILQFLNPTNFVCVGPSVSFDASETRDYPAEIPLTWQDQAFVDSTLVETVTHPLPAAPDNVGTFGPFSHVYTITPFPAGSFQYYRVWSLYEGSTLLSTSTIHVGCNYTGTPGVYTVTTYPVENVVHAEATDPTASDTPDPSITPSATPVGGSATVELPFSGPGLPGPGARNLVLFNEDTAVLSAPDGVFTGRIMRACQTAFVLLTSEDAAWGQLFVMGGWVPMENTRDVPEDYGQPGSPIAPDCVGK
jgi:hypothetical protein